MRKNYKQKRRSCALCKPQKVGWESRWTTKESARRNAMELDIRRTSHEDLADLNDAQNALAGTVVCGAKPLEQTLKEFRH